MDKRTFLLSCSAFAVALSMHQPARALKALAVSTTDRSDAERILSITQTATVQFKFLSIKETEAIVRQKKDRYLLLSLQPYEEYMAGHVPEAWHFPPEDLADPQKLAAFLGKMPRHKSVVVTCPNGHLSCAVALFLRQLGFDATAMAFGMYGWNRDYAGSGMYKGDIDGDICQTSIHLDLSTYTAQKTFSGLDDKTLLAKSSRGKFLKEIEPEDFRDNAEKYLSFCLRRPEDYALGHIPGAFNLPSEAFYSGDKIILQIPQDRDIVLNCYVGHYSSGASLILTQLGYNVSTLAWGMAGWNNLYIGQILQSLLNSAILPIEKGAGRSFMNN